MPSTSKQGSQGRVKQQKQQFSKEKISHSSESEANNGDEDDVKEIFRHDEKKNKNPNESFQQPDDENEKLLKQNKKVKYYKTSIERWRPVGDEKIHCPRCHSFKRPTIRTVRHHVTKSSITSTFLMACWPLCLSPCYLPAPSFENLHCPVCNFHLGIFDHQKKTVISNPKIYH